MKNVETSKIVDAAIAAKTFGFERLCLLCLAGFSGTEKCPKCETRPTEEEISHAIYMVKTRGHGEDVQTAIDLYNRLISAAPSNNETEREWLLRQMESQSLETLRDIAKSYPTERTLLPIVKIVRATVISRSCEADRISLYTEFKSPVYPFNEQHFMSFDAARDTGVRFVKDKFGLDAEVIRC